MRPTREHATNAGQTYMVTSATWERRPLFRNERWARLLIDALFHYRGSAYLLHEFVIIPDHFHVLITPKTSLEKAVQFIKGGFSYRAKKELGSNMEIWQKGFSDHRIRDAGDYWRHVDYIRQNLVRKRLCERADEYPYSSAAAISELDAVPQGLKPQVDFRKIGSARLKAAPFQDRGRDGASEAAPFQNRGRDDVSEAAAFQNRGPDDASGAAPFQNRGTDGASEAAPFQNKPVASVTFPNKSGKIAS